MYKNTTQAGVIIARFQVPDLHEGHRHLMEYVLKRHERVIVLIGDRRIQRNAQHPLDFKTRKLMVQSAYPSVEIELVLDVGNDRRWSEDVDDLLASMGAGNAVLYGSRGSFIPHYHGTHRTVRVRSRSTASGTEIRNGIGIEPLDSAEFRAGAAYANTNRYPQVHRTVDIAVIRGLRLTFIEDGIQEVLLGKRDPRDEKWRFPGGFVDPTDLNDEAAARRELREEAGDLYIDELRELGVARIDNWRYRDSKDANMTTFFTCDYLNGELEPRDDLAVLAWKPAYELPGLIDLEHKPLADMLLCHLNLKKKGCAA